MTRDMVFSRFERFWHWSQAALIIHLIMTGFEVNGAYEFYGYERAAELHRFNAWLLLGLSVFAIFWHFISGEWKQYIPTTDKMRAVLRYYTLDIFKKDSVHPFKMTPLVKHNPLQRIAYSAFNLMILPIIWVSGLLYMYYNDWPDIGMENVPLALVAGIHTAAGFAMLVFLIVHVYMIFTGKPLMRYLKAMITGYEDSHD